MKDKPRDRNAFILNKAMYQNILGVGGFFFVLLLVLLYVFEHSNITQLTDLLNVQLGASDGLTPYELTLFFTIFVMTHFFYLFCVVRNFCRLHAFLSLNSVHNSNHECKNKERSWCKDKDTCWCVTDC